MLESAVPVPLVPTRAMKRKLIFLGGTLLLLPLLAPIAHIVFETRAWLQSQHTVTKFSEERAGPWVVSERSVGGKRSLLPYQIDNGNIKLTLCYIDAYSHRCRQLMERPASIECPSRPTLSTTSPIPPHEFWNYKLWASCIRQTTLARLSVETVVVRHADGLVVEVVSVAKGEQIFSAQALNEARADFHGKRALLLPAVLGLGIIACLIRWLIYRPKAGTPGVARTPEP